MTEVVVNLGELFRQKIKNQPVQPVKHEKIREKVQQKPYRESGILGLSRVNNALNYSQKYFFLLKYIDKKNKHRTMQRKNLLELYNDANDKGLKFNVQDKHKARHFIRKNSKSEKEYNFLVKNILQEEVVE